MPRIVRRQYDRKPDTSSVAATHVVQIGAKGRSKGGKEIPVRLRGFVVRRDSVKADGTKPIDYEIMSALGFDRARVDAGVKDGYEAGEDCLPKELRIRLRWGAVNAAETWEFPGTFSEQFEMHNKLGLACYGDGKTASRKESNGTRAKIDCEPVGTTFHACPFSVRKECKPTARFAFVLLGPDGNPLGPKDAVFRFECHSDASATNIGDELTRAAEYCRGIAGPSRSVGHIAGIRGTLRVSIRTKRTGIAETPTANVPIVSLALDREDLEARREEIWRRETALASALSGHQLPTPEERARIEAPRPPDEADFADVEAEPESEPDDSLPFDSTFNHSFSPDPAEEADAEELDALLDQLASAHHPDQSPQELLREITTEMVGKPVPTVSSFFARRGTDEAAHGRAMALMRDVLAQCRHLAKPAEDAPPESESNESKGEQS